MPRTWSQIEAEALNLLAVEGGLTFTQLIRKLGLPYHTVRNLLHALRERGLVKTERRRSWISNKWCTHYCLKQAEFVNNSDKEGESC